MAKRRVLIMGAAGRDFHNFNVVYRDDPETEVVAFTATQIPYIDDRTYPSGLAGPRYPNGVPIHEESELVRLIEEHRVDDVVFAYSDVTHDHVMHMGSTVLAAGANFVLLGPDATMLDAAVPVVAVTAVRTGVGKSQTTRAVAGTLKDLGKKVVAVRHPMPYGDLTAQRVQRFAELEDLDRHHCTIEEREEYEPHIASGTVIYAGVDYGEILAQAQQECDVLLWDGGNNDLPFYRPTVHVVLVDPLRAGHELRYHPGEANLRRADVVLINKMDSATSEQVEMLERTIAETNPNATLWRRETRGHRRRSRGDRREAGAGGRGRADPHPRRDEDRRRRGGSRAAGSGRDRRPPTVGGGNDRRTFEKYDVGKVLPAMGYSRATRRDGQDHRVGGRGPGRDRHADRPAQGDRHPEAGGPGSLRARRTARFSVAGRCAPAGAGSVMERVVVALGGNALLRRGADDTYEEMYRAARIAAERIADIAASGWEVVVTHGNGPQVGRILLQQEAPPSRSIRCHSTCAEPRARARSATSSR